MLSRLLIAIAFAAAAGTAAAGDVPLGSAHAMVVDEVTGEVLLEKDTGTPAPIASLTKLFTAMVVLDAAQDPAELLRITDADVDYLKGTRAGIPVGMQASRAALLELTLLASDNRAASALARNMPGGMMGFRDAVRRKIESLDLRDTLIEEPTGLSPNNRASARDMVKVLRAAAEYNAIADITSKSRTAVYIEGRRWQVRNTNRLVGTPGWNILLSKTGFTNEAGRCVSMRVQAAGRTVMVVLMGAIGAADRTVDALNIRRWLAGEAVHARTTTRKRASLQRHAPPLKALKTPTASVEPQMLPAVLPVSDPAEPASQDIDT